MHLKFTHLFCWIACLTASVAYGQKNASSTSQFLKTLSDKTNSTDVGYTSKAALVENNPADAKENLGKGAYYKRFNQNRLFSQATLNRYIAAQTVKYLTGKEDVSYYDTYFTASTVDGSLNFGKTTTFKDSFERVKSVWNYGLQTKVLTGLGNLFSGRKFSREVGFNTNFTLFARGSVWYYKPAADSMVRERAYIQQTIDIEQADEQDVFDQKQAKALAEFQRRPRSEAALNDFRASQERDCNAFVESLDKKYKDRYFEMEEAAAKPRVNFIRTNWWTFHGSTSGVTDSVSPDSLTPSTDRLFIGAKAGLNFSVFAQDFRPGKWNRLRSLVTLSATLQNTNQLRLLDRYGAKAAPILLGKSVTKEGVTSWQGLYDNWAIMSFEARALLTLPRVTDVVSLDVFGSTTTGRYASQDVGFGFLFTLTGQDKKSSVNTELMFKFVDVSRKILPGKDALDRLQIGISLALPFNSNLNSL